MIARIRGLDAHGHTRTIGIGLAAVTALVSGFSVFVNASAVRAVSDPVLFTTLKNGVAAVVLTLRPARATARSAAAGSAAA